MNLTDLVLVQLPELVLQDSRTVELIIQCGASAGVDVNSELAEKLARYVGLLAKWNRKINLTALQVDLPMRGAIDRLIIEPLIAARHVRLEDQRTIDVGSGGGSPAIPLALACPWLLVTMVESRGRKAAFLREAIRNLELAGTKVENCRIEEVVDRSDLKGTIDLVTMRAVRADGGLLAGLSQLLGSTGRIFAFGDIEFGGANQLRRVERVVLGEGNHLDLLAKVN